MAGGKSKKGRGGSSSSRKELASAQRNSSASSTPTTPNRDSPPSVSIPPSTSDYHSADAQGSASRRITPQSLQIREHGSHSRSHNSGPTSSHQRSRLSNQASLHSTPPPPPPPPQQVLFQNEPVLQDGGSQSSSSGSSSDDSDEEEVDHPPNAQHQMTLEALLRMPGRDDFLDKLSPTVGQGLWFSSDRDETLLVARIARLIQEKFDGPYYSWKVTPFEIRDLWFTQLAHEFTWDPLITHLVRKNFDIIAKRRLKGMVSYVRRVRHRPSWIRKKLWMQMEDYWNTKAAKKKSANASASRMSRRKGKGPHKHVGGPKSHARIQVQMEKEEGRPVSIAEVFMKTHTRKDGSYVDEKAKQIGDAYLERLQSTESQLEVDISTTSDGASRTPQLTTEQKNALFLETTMVDARGNPYGLGSLSKVHGKRQRLELGSSSSPSSAIVTLEEKLKDAEMKMAQMADDNNKKIDYIVNYLKIKDPALPAWILQGAPSQTLPEADHPIHENDPSIDE